MTTELPPHDKDAEMAVLGSILRDRTGLDDVADILRVTDFYLGVHQSIWRAFLWLRDENKPIDMVTVADRLRDTKELVELGSTGYAYLLALFNSAPTGSAEYHAQIVRDVALRRDLWRTAHAIIPRACERGTDVNEFLADVEKRVFEVFQRRYGGARLIGMAEAVSLALQELDRRKSDVEGQESTQALPTGLIDLDRVIVGMHRKELVVLAARPSVGKTLVALNIVANIAKLGKRIFFASLEQSTTELVHRLLSRFAGVNSHRMRKGKLDPADVTRILEIQETLSRQQIVYDDTPSQSSARILSNARRLQMQAPLDLVVVDYLQIMEAENSRSSDNEAIGRNAMRMKQLAKELSVPVLLLAQLNRKLEDRSDKRPKLSDLRGSGEIEQHADTVLLLHKPEENNYQRDNDLLEVYVAKQRNGPLGEVNLLHKKRVFEITNYAPESNGYPDSPGPKGRPGPS